MTAAPVAFVTGAGRGIGEAIAVQLAAKGYRVAVAARSFDQVAGVAARIGGLPIELDVTDTGAVSAAVARVASDLGPIDLLVNNAGIAGAGGATWEQEIAGWWRVFEVNVLGTFVCSRAVLPAMRARGLGRIVNVASNAACFNLDGDPDTRISAAYMASKAAVIRFSEALAAETRPDGVFVFAISPGMVRSEMTAPIFGSEWDDDIWAPPELTAELVATVGGGALDSLSGRYIHAVNDDWRTLPERADVVLARDGLALRVTP